MKIIYFACVFILLVSFNNSMCQNKIELLNQISKNEGAELIESLSSYSMVSLFDDLHPKGKNDLTNLGVDTIDLYWKALRQVVKHIPKSYEEMYEINYFLPKLITDILKYKGDQEYDKLTAFYRSLPDTSYLRGESFLIPFFQYEVYKEIKNIFEDKIKPTTYLEDATIIFERNFGDKKNEYLNKCKELFSAVKNYYQQRVLNDTVCGWYSFQSNEDLFYKNIEQILFNSSTDDFKNLNQFQWGGWCGTGSEYFYSKQYLVELLILLRERDYLSILGRKDYYSGPNLSENTKIKLLELCDIDWIDFYTGSIFSGELNSIPSNFAKSGSDKAALNLLEFQDSISSKGWFIIKCAEFINPGSEEERQDFDFYDDNQFLKAYESNLPVYSIPVRDEIKKKLKKEIINISTNSDEFYLCQSAVNALHNIKFDEEVKEAFIHLTKSKFSIIRSNAANILKKKGIIVELPNDDGKIKFKFIVDGQPLKKDVIRWELYNTSKPDKSFLNGSDDTNDEGLLFVSRDLLLDRLDEIQKIIFYPDTRNYGGKQILFYTESHLPKDLSDTTIIHISTVIVSIKFHLNRDADFYKGKKMHLHAFPPKVSMLDYELEVKDEFNFPLRFQKDMRCSFSAYVPGALSWFSPRPDTLKNDIILDAHLENGTIVIFEIVAPGGKVADKSILFELNRKGKSTWEDFFHYDYSLGGYESLPIGEYYLNISSSAEKKSKYHKSDNECTEIVIEDHYPDYQGKMISFTISKESPPKIDLGTIILEPLSE